MKTYLYIDVRNVILIVLKQGFYILNGLKVEITHEISTRAQNFKDPNFLKYLNLGKNILDTCFYDGFWLNNLKLENLMILTSTDCTVLRESVS